MDTYRKPQKPCEIHKLIRNAVRCNHCGEVIESTYRHNFVTCKCGCCSVDGGLDYIRRSFANFRDDFTELSEYEPPKTPHQ